MSSRGSVGFVTVRSHGARRLWIAGLALLAALAALVSRPSRSEAAITFTPSGLIEEKLVGGLPWVTGAAFAPDGRLFVIRKNGVVRVWQNGALLPTPFIDISAEAVSYTHLTLPTTILV